MRRSEDFTATVRGGARAGRGTLVVHSRAMTAGHGRRVGLVVAKTVGNAVVRNRVRRRLRAVVVEHVGALPADSAVVVRALPPASEASFSQIRDDYCDAVRTATRRAAAKARV